MARVTARIVAHLETWRPYTLAYPGLVGLAGAALAQAATGGEASGWRLLGAWAVPTLGWLAGLYGGDYFDRRLDALAKPHRPIPSGRLPARAVLGWATGYAVTGTLILVLLNPRTLVVVAASAVGIALYNIRLKSHGILGDLAAGFSSSGCVVLVGAMAVAPWPPAHVLPVAVVLGLQATGYNIILTLTDVAGDRVAGWATMPVRRGRAFTVRVLAGVMVCWLGLAVLAGGTPLVLAASAALSIAVLAAISRPLRAFEWHALDRVLLPGAFLATDALLLVAAALAGTYAALRTLLYPFETGARTGAG